MFASTYAFILYYTGIGFSFLYQERNESFAYTAVVDIVNYHILSLFYLKV